MVAVMDPFVGRLASLLVIASYVTSNLWMAYGGSAALAGGLNMVGWLALFYGNFVLEGRSPAMVNNLFRVRVFGNDENIIPAVSSLEISIRPQYALCDGGGGLGHFLNIFTYRCSLLAL